METKEMIVHNFSLTIIMITIVFVLFALIYVYFYNFKGVRRKEQSKLRIEAAKMIAGFSIVGSIILGFWHNKETLELNRMDRLTERYFKAVEALSNEDIYGTKRMGGIFTLQEIATSENDFKMPVIWVLTNFINERYPYPRKSSNQPNYKNQNRTITDVQAVLNAINKIKKHYEADNPQVLLWETDLEGSFLQEYNFSNVKFSGSNLKNSKMKDANLKGSIFGADKRAGDYTLKPAILYGVDLEGAELIEAKLDGVVLEDAKLAGTRLEGVDLSNTIGLKPDQIEKACINEYTILPEGKEFDKIKKKRIEEINKDKRMCEKTQYLPANTAQENAELNK